MENQLFARRKQSVITEIISNQPLLLEALMREDWNSFRVRNNSSVYYPAAMGDGIVSVSSVVPTDGLCQLLPFIAPVRSRLVEIAVLKTAGSTSTPIRLGLYAADPTSLFPTGRLHDSGSTDTTAAGRYGTTLDIVLEEGLLYYLAFVRQGGSALGFGHNAATNFVSILGIENPVVGSNSPAIGWSVAGLTSGALPNPWVSTTKLLKSGSSLPVIFGRLNTV